jgi:hypothetical protein
MEAMPIPKPPIILKTTKSVTDSGKNEGKPEPQADMVNNKADSIKEFFLPKALLMGPERMAPNRQPINALPTTHPLTAALSSKYLLK